MSQESLIKETFVDSTVATSGKQLETYSTYIDEIVREKQYGTFMVTGSYVDKVTGIGTVPVSIYGTYRDSVLRTVHHVSIEVVSSYVDNVVHITSVEKTYGTYCDRMLQISKIPTKLSLEVYVEGKKVGKS